MNRKNALILWTVFIVLPLILSIGLASCNGTQLPPVETIAPPATQVPVSDGTLYWFTPIWDLGAGDNDPRIGSAGTALMVAHVEPSSNGEVISLWLYVKTGRDGFYAGQGSGGYQFFLPPEYAHLAPNEGVDFAGHANVWIAGGGRSEFDGSIKWTFRNPDHGPKLIVTFDGAEWSPTSPKALIEGKFRAYIEYAK